MKRRQFIKRVVQTGAVVSATALSGKDVLGANERVRVGLIGCGGRGMFDAKLMRDVPNAEFVAVCDLYPPDRKSTRLNSSHITNSYAVFCLKKKKNQVRQRTQA